MGWFEAWEQAMAAVAFAEAGEADSARDLMAPSRDAQRKVLLGVGGQCFTPDVLRHSLELCHRMEAGLEVLHLWPESEAAKTPLAADTTGTAMFTRLREQLAARRVFYRYVVGVGEVAEEIARHAAGRRDIVLVLLASSEAWEKGGGKPEQLLRQLTCPVALLRPSRV